MGFRLTDLSFLSGFGNSPKIDRAYDNFMGGLDRSNNEFRDVNQNNFQLPGFERLQGDTNAFQRDVNRRRDVAASNRFGRQQGFLGDMVMQRARGQGPSVADAQLQSANQQALAQQQALAATGRGGNAALRQRSAMSNAANTAAQLGSQSVAQRLQEQQAAQGLANNIFGQARGQDINVANLALQNRQLNDQTQMGLLRQLLNNSQAQQAGNIAFEGARTSRFGSMLGVPTQTEQALGLGQGIAQMAMGGG